MSLARGRKSKSRPGSNHQGQFENHKAGTTSLPVAVTVSRSPMKHNLETTRWNHSKIANDLAKQQNWFSKKSKGLTAGGGALPGITCGPGIGDVLVKIFSNRCGGCIVLSWWLKICWKEFDCFQSSEVWDGTSTCVKSEIFEWFCFSVSFSKSKSCKSLHKSPVLGRAKVPNDLDFRNSLTDWRNWRNSDACL